MRKIIGFLFVAFIFSFHSSLSLAESTLTNLVKKIQPAVATIITYDENKKPFKQGSGFFIDPEGHIITNYHILDGAYEAEVKI